MPRIEKKLDQIISLLSSLTVLTNIYRGVIVADLVKLKVEVERKMTVKQSAITFVSGVVAQIAAAGTDPVALAALQMELKQSTDDLAAAIVANTPAA